MTINGKIATLLLRAQNSSDGGKHKHIIINNRRSYRDNAAGYQSKDSFVWEAIDLICRNRKSCDFKFAVTDGHITPYLIYFETIINDKKLQVSFHSYDSRLSKFRKNSFRMKWDKADSRESALEIYHNYVKNGKYGGDAYD